MMTGHHTISMKNTLFTLLLILTCFACKAHAHGIKKDTITRQQFIRSQTVKADTLNQMALNLAKPGANYKDLNLAIEYIMKGLHVYSRYRDSIGLRQTFDHLALVYHLQKKYVQAKWFYIQSNSLSRDLKDTSNIIHSLLALAAVKSDIKDYSMADRDLHEAIALVKSRPGINTQIEVLKVAEVYYSKKGDTKMADRTTNRLIYLSDSVTRHNNDIKFKLLKAQQYKQQLAAKQKETLLLQNQMRLQKLLRQKNAITTITISIITIVTGLLVWLYFRKKAKTDK